MTENTYLGIKSHVVLAEDTAWGTPGVPTGADYVDIVSTFNYTITNNIQRIQGIGEGRNATNAVPQGLDVTGSMEWELTDPDFLQYCIIANRAGAGTVADPYEIQEVDRIGYGAGECNTLTLQSGSEGGTDDVLDFDGVAINNFTLNATTGETIKCSCDWTGRTVNSSTSALTYTGPTNRPFTFVDGSCSVGADTVGKVSSFELTCANNLFIYRSLGSRLINQPEAGIRRYDFTLVMRMHFDDTASVLSGVEGRGLTFSGLPAATTPLDDPAFTAVAVSVDLVEGGATDDRVINVDLETCYIESASTPIELENGVFEITLSGFGLAGLTDGAAKVPIRWYTIA